MNKEQREKLHKKVLGLLAKGLSVRQVGKLVGLDHSTVVKIRKRKQKHK